MTESPARRPPAGRYGPEPTARSARRGRLVVIAIAVLGLAVALWVAVNMATQPVSFKDVGFRIEGNQAVDVTFEVTKPREQTVRCTVTALSESYAEVGVRTVEVGPSDEATRRVTVTVPTTELAVTGTVESCVLAEDAAQG